MTATVTSRPRLGLSFDASGVPYPAPPAGGRLRIAFVGQSTYFVATSLNEDSARIKTGYLQAPVIRSLFRLSGGGTADPADAALTPADAGRALREVGIRYVLLNRRTAPPPLPRKEGKKHSDLDRRLNELRAVDMSNFDRVVSFDPLMIETAQEILPVWRAVPLPVADRYYRPVRPITGKPRICFVGRSTQHREAFLLPVKHEFDILHLAFGVDADRLETVMDEHDVTINLHNEPYESFENRVCIHLAAGHLVISEKLNPRHGLEPGIDYLEIWTPEQLLDMLVPLHRWPGTYDRVRIRGRQKAEQYRASAVYPRLIHDLYLDLAAFGTERPNT